MARLDTVEGLNYLVRRMRQEENGRELRRDLGRNMRRSLRPAVAAARSGIMSMPSSGSSRSSPGLRTSIAKRIKSEVKLGGRWTGARVRARKLRSIRNFANAPKRTQRPQGWRTMTFGDRESWRVQHGKARWFDESMDGIAPGVRDEIVRAMNDMAGRIANG